MTACMLPPMTKSEWPAISDEALVDRLIPAIQKAIADVHGAEPNGDATVAVNAPDTANAMLLILATLLEISPAAASPIGMRKLAEAAGKELLSMIKDTRQLRLAEPADEGAVN